MHDTLNAEVVIRFLAHKGDGPKHLLATAEFVVYFAGALPDMKITGLSLWKGDSSATVTLTLPSGPGTAGEYYCFRPVSGDIQDLVHFKREVVKAYHAWAAAGAGRSE